MQALAAVTVVSVLVGSAQAEAQSSALVLVAHKDLGLTGASRQDAGRVFLGLSRELGGKRVAPLVVGQKEDRAGAIARISGRTAAAVEAHFVKLELRGEGRWPALAADGAEMVRRALESATIAGRPGVVACLTQEELEGLSPKLQALLTVIAIDGLNPGQPGYPLANAGN